MHPMKTPLLIAKFAPLAIVATLAVVGAVYAHVALPNPAAAQDTPSVAISLSPSGSVEPGTAITVSMSFGNLASDTDTKTTDYIFRADVLDSDNEAADACEGGGMGKDRYFYQVDDDPETREATVSADCPAGDYTVRVNLSSAANEEVASASAAFSVAAPPDPSVTVELSPSDFVEEGAEITAVMSFGDLASDSDTSTIDYVVRADVLDSEDGAADDCEGNGLGADRNINKVDEDPETRTGTVSADCPAGAYTLRVSIYSAGNTELASASAGFFILRAPVVIEPPTLTALSVSHGDPAVEVELSPAFDSGALTYDADVTVAQVTVAPTAGDPDATVAYLDGNGDAIADADPVAAGHQVDLEAGSNTVKVAVSKDSLTTTYAVNLLRLVTQQQTADATKDFNLHSDNDKPTGIWSNGTTIWVADNSDDKLYAYALDGGARQTSQEFNLHSDNANPWAIWSDGTTIWVADNSDDKLYAYALDGGARQTSEEFGLHSDNASAVGIWSDNTTIWVADNDDRKLYAYALDGGARQTSEEFGLHSDNSNARGIWSDGTTIWVVDNAAVGEDKLYAYALDGGARDADFDIVLSSGNNAPWGIWSDYTTMWVAQRKTTFRLFAYDLPVAECPGQFVSSTEYVARPTGCPRLTLLDFGEVRVEWDAVPGATGNIRTLLHGRR